MIVDLSSIISYGSSLLCLDDGAKDRILFLNQNWSTPMPDDALNKEPSDCRQPGSNKKSLDSDNREPTEQERNLKSQLQPETLGEQICVCVYVCVCIDTDIECINQKHSRYSI